MKQNAIDKKERMKNVTYSFKELRKLNDIDKKDYIEKIMEDDAQVSQYIKKVQSKIEDAQDQIQEEKMQVEDVNDNFQGEMKLINTAIVNTAIRKGITKLRRQLEKILAIQFLL